MERKKAAVTDAKSITSSLRRVRQDMTAGLTQAEDAVNVLMQDGAIIEDSLHDHKYVLKGSLQTTKQRLTRIKTAETREKWSIFLSLSFFTSVVVYIVAKRTRLLTVAWLTVHGAIRGKDFIASMAATNTTPAPATAVPAADLLGTLTAPGGGDRQHIVVEPGDPAPPLGVPPPSSATAVPDTTEEVLPHDHDHVPETEEVEEEEEEEEEEHEAPLQEEQHEEVSVAGTVATQPQEEPDSELDAAPEELNAPVSPGGDELQAPQEETPSEPYVGAEAASADESTPPLDIEAEPSQAEQEPAADSPASTIDTEEPSPPDPEHIQDDAEAPDADVDADPIPVEEDTPAVAAEEPPLGGDSEPAQQRDGSPQAEEVEEEVPPPEPQEALSDAVDVPEPASELPPLAPEHDEHAEVDTLDALREVEDVGGDGDGDGDGGGGAFDVNVDQPPDAHGDEL